MQNIIIKVIFQTVSLESKNGTGSTIYHLTMSQAFFGMYLFFTRTSKVGVQTEQ